MKRTKQLSTAIGFSFVLCLASVASAAPETPAADPAPVAAPEGAAPADAAVPADSAEPEPAAPDPAAPDPAAIEAEAAKAAASVIDGFAAAVAKDESLTDEQRTRVNEIVTSLRNEPEMREATVALGLREISPEFSAALEALGEEKLEPAIAGFTKLKDSADPYLAAESAFYLARALLLSDKFEEALPLLDSVVEKHAEHSLNGSQALFLRGVAETRLLKRKEATESLSAFLKQYPAASERAKIAAWQMLQMLQEFEEGSLRDIQENMEFSRRRLALDNPYEETREAQKRAVAMLEKLIKKAEEQEQQGQGQGKSESQSKSEGNNQGDSEGKGEGEGQSTAGQGGSKQNDQSPDKIVRQLRGGPRTPWDHLRDKEREARAFAALKAQFPSRYQRLVEQYYRNLQDEDSAEEDE